MQVTLGKDGCEKSWQDPFPETIECCHCGEVSRIAFVAHEGMENKSVPEKCVCELHNNDWGDGGEGFWMHDCGAFAIYICKKCFSATTLFNQA